MYTIKLDAVSKALITTSYTQIFQGENCADTIAILIPQKIGDVEPAACTVFATYVRADGKIDVDILERDDSQYQNYHQYHFPITSQLTAVAGIVKFYLQMNNESGTILKTGIVTMDVAQQDEGCNFGDQITAMYKLSKRIDDLAASKADNIVYHEDGEYIQLEASGLPIGDKIDTTKIAENGDDVIIFDDSKELNPPNDGDDVIEF